MADITLEVGKTYPVLVDGAPAAATIQWASSIGGVINVSTQADGTVVAQPLAPATGEVLSATEGARSGSVTLDLVAAPLAITFGNPL